jgi:hypothetical protein
MALTGLADGAKIAQAIVPGFINICDESMSHEREKTEKSALSQRQRFIEAARELGCDESEEAFAEVVRQVASAPPAPAAAKSEKKISTRKKL